MWVRATPDFRMPSELQHASLYIKLANAAIDLPRSSSIRNYRFTRTYTLALGVRHPPDAMKPHIIATALLASWTQASTLTPPILPLIVRNPYLSTWLQNAREEPWSKWPMFWTGAEVGFSVMASLPQSRQVFPLLGRPHDSLEHNGKEQDSLPSIKPCIR